MTKLNKDGLPSGQPVTFAEVQAANRARKRQAKGDASNVPASPDEINKMKKSDVVQWLEAHNCEFDKSAGVGDLRQALISVMFVNV